MEDITTPPTIEELQDSIAESAKTIDELRAKERARSQQLQQLHQQYTERLQQSSTTVINTKGQIAALEDLLKMQEAAMHRDEGVLQAINSMQ